MDKSDTAIRAAAQIRSPAAIAARAEPRPRRFADRITAWQRRRGRHDLPWQRSRDPYAIWVSEIMLQQTQVATVAPYFERFLTAFPTVAALARAERDEVMRHWSGLGYYSRARNLHAAAQRVVADFDARFPREPQVLADLPGIGRSTAAAIVALAYEVPAAILDGNVKRVLCRVFGIEGDPGSARVQRELWALAESLVPAREVATYTQGMMDLGATVCLRRAPRCALCPLRADCIAAAQGRTEELPAVRSRRPRPARSVAMLVLHHGERVLLEKRPAAGVWGGLWCFPEAEVGEDAAALCLRRFGVRADRIVSLPAFEHGFTHFRLHIHPLRVEVAQLAQQAAEPGTVWLPLADARNAAVPAPVRRLLELR